MKYVLETIYQLSQRKTDFSSLLGAIMAICFPNCIFVWGAYTGACMPPIQPITSLQTQMYFRPRMENSYFSARGRKWVSHYKLFYIFFTVFALIKSHSRLISRLYRTRTKWGIYLCLDLKAVMKCYRIRVFTCLVLWERSLSFWSLTFCFSYLQYTNFFISISTLPTQHHYRPFSIDI